MKSSSEDLLIQIFSLKISVNKFKMNVDSSIIRPPPPPCPKKMVERYGVNNFYSKYLALRFLRVDIVINLKKKHFYKKSMEQS